jgi:tol-pal system protein YbgF
MKHFLAALTVVVPAVLLSANAMSAAGIVEAQPYTPGQAPIGAQAGGGSNDALVMLLDQFREMRAELETLRGLVEEQRYDLRNLQRDSLDRYTDLDSRISFLSESMRSANAAMTTPAPSMPATIPNPSVTNVAPIVNTAPGAAVSSPASSASVPSANTGISTSTTMVQSVSSAPMAVSPAPTVDSTTVEPTMLSEQQLYQLALDSLLQEQQYQRSINHFEQYLSLYPAGRFVTNSYYWKGQAYLNLAMLNEAREAFEVIVTQYPDGRKVDDAMYSLGTVYEKLGNTVRARDYLSQVQSRFPNTSAANLADLYLRSMN